MNNRTGTCRPVRPRRGGLSLVEVLVAVAVIALLVGLLLTAVQRVRGRAAGTRCENNLRQIGLGFQAHHTAHGFFPSGGWDWSTPPYYVGGVPAVGKEQRAGWAFQLLPYVEARAVWESGPATAVAATIPVYFCPVRRPLQTVTYPDEYAAPVGAPGADEAHGLCDYAAANLDGTGPVRQYDPVRVADVTDGTANTLLVAEKRINLALMGTPQPDDNEGYTAGFDEDTVRKTSAPPAPDFRGDGSAGQLFGGSHPGVVVAVFCDGSVRPVRYSIDPAVFAGLGTRAGGETVTDLP